MQVRADSPAAVPLFRISQRCLLERYAVEPSDAPDVEVAVHYRASVETAVPTTGPASSAPRSESGNPRKDGVLLFKRIVIDQDFGKIRPTRRQPGGGVPATDGAPRIAIRIRVGMQRHLVGADGSGFARPPDNVGAG